MSAVPVKDTFAKDSAAVAPTTMATEASSDPIRPTGTDALVPESRPEVTSATEATHTVAGAPTGVSAPTEQMAGGDALKVEAQPISEGILGYKAPGLIKSLRFSKKFFWFGDEALEEKALSTYLREEKPAIAHHNVAHAGQSGKGLLLFAKRVEDKSHPAGVLNLGDATDVTKEEFHDFSFKIHGHRHTFQAASRAERDSWLVVVETKITEAKSAREGIVGSEGYKNHLSKLSGPVVAGLTPKNGSKSTSRPPKATEEPISKTINDKETPVANTAAAVETTPKDSEKSRSQSRKRGSIFGKVLGMKEGNDEKKEIKKEEKAEEKIEKAEIKEANKETKHGEAGAVEPAPLNAAAIAARVVGEPVVPVEGATTAGTAESTAAPAQTSSMTPTQTDTTHTAASKTKRGSVFGSLFAKKDSASPTRERKERDVAPVVPAKDTETTSTTATASAAAPTTVGHATEAVPATEGAAANTTTPETTTPATAPTTTAHKTTSPTESKGGLFGFMKPKESTHEAKKDTAPTSTSPAPVSTTTAALPAATGHPNAPGTDVPTTSTTVTATSPDANHTPKDKRRQSFFGTLSGKKEKSAESEVGDDSRKTSSGGVAGGLGGLFRRASRGVRGPAGPVTDSKAPPAAAAEKDVAKMAGEGKTATATAAPATSGESAIEDSIEPTGGEAGKMGKQEVVSASA